jgi:hypothetical protein
LNRIRLGRRNGFLIASQNSDQPDRQNENGSTNPHDGSLAYHIAMPRVVPAESDILCEACGYTLNGLPTTSNCPECGAPIAASTIDSGRGLTGFEQRPGGSSFAATTLAVLLRPRRFYRALATRHSHPAAEWFAQRHRLIASFLFSSAAIGYALWLESMRRRPRIGGADWFGVSLLVLVLAIGLYFFMGWITRLATWLSSMEGAYWGMRLPYDVVKRCLQYHTAAYLPIGILANLLVWGYRWLLETGVLLATTGVAFAYTLSAAVVVSAAYLFQMYMVAMRNTRYANH